MRNPQSPADSSALRAAAVISLSRGLLASLAAPLATFVRPSGVDIDQVSTSIITLAK
jgi:hypothetical protein